MSAGGNGDDGDDGDDGDGGGGPGRREVAHRLFAAEFEDATLQYSESDEERAPNYVVTPSGARVNRMFFVGVLTELEQVNESMLRARIVDPTGAFVAYAGQYQPDELAFLERVEPPTFLAVTGKARTFQPEDSDRVFTSVRPESINEVDAETRDRWVVDAARRTLERADTASRAIEAGLAGDALTESLIDDGGDRSLASGIALALEHYGTTPAYLAALRETAIDAVRVVAGEIEEAEGLSVAPDEGGDASVPDRTPSPEPGASAGTGIDGAGDEEPATEAPGGRTDAGSDGPRSSETDTDPGAEATTGKTSTAATDSLETADAGGQSTSASADDAGPGTGGSRDDPDATASTDDVGEFDPGEFDAGDGAATAPGDDADLADDESFDPDEDVLDPDEREQIEAEYGTDFETASDVEAEPDAAPDAGSEPDPDSEPESEAEAEPGPAESEAATGSAGAPDGAGEPATAGAGAGDSTGSPAGDDGPDADGDAGEETGAGGTEVPDPDEGAPDAAETGRETPDDDEPDADEEVDPETAVLASIEALDDGDGADRDAVAGRVADELGVSEAEADDAIEEAMMSGRCYEPADGRVKSI